MVAMVSAHDDTLPITESAFKEAYQVVILKGSKKAYKEIKANLAQLSKKMEKELKKSALSEQKQKQVDSTLAKIKREKGTLTGRTLSYSLIERHFKSLFKTLFDKVPYNLHGEYIKNVLDQFTVRYHPYVSTLICNIALGNDASLEEAQEFEPSSKGQHLWATTAIMILESLRKNYEKDNQECVRAFYLYALDTLRSRLRDSDLWQDFCDSEPFRFFMSKVLRSFTLLA